jgi:hypothetical protein
MKGSNVHPYLIGMRSCNFRIVARGLDQPSAIGSLNDILPLLQFDETQLDEVFIKHIRYENDPITYPISYNSGVSEASIMLTAIYYLL